MDAILEALWIALSTVSQPGNFLLIIIATMFGLFMGILPGLGGSTALALLIPLTFGIDPLVAFMMFAAAKGGTNFGGSLTAILINTPGQAPNAATLLDGYPMAEDGRAGEAIGASAIASMFGAIFSIIVLLASIPIMIQILLMFGPPEIFWLGIWGLTLIAVVVKGGVITGLIAALLGVIFALHGQNDMTATHRWTYDMTPLIDGIGLVPALIGLFAVAEMINLLSSGKTISGETEKIVGGQWMGAKSVMVHRWVFLRSAVVGLVVGMIPGVGGAAANFVAYFQAVKTSVNNELFGKGDIRGVIASEASNDSKDGGAFIPTLGFGIPGSASMAVLFGGFILHGITPGPQLFQDHLDVVMVIIVSLLIANVLTSCVGLVFANQFAYVTRMDIRLVAPIVIGIAFFGAFALQNNVYDLFITLVFGILGVAMIKGNISRVPLILAMVLTPVVESNFFRSLQISSGEYAVFVRSPLAIMLILLVILSLFQHQISQLAKGALNKYVQ